MPVKVRCPQCRHVMAAPDAARGKAVRCKSCQGKVPVPVGKSAAAGAPAPKPARKKVRKAVEETPSDTDDLFGDIDLSRIEDTSVRICSRCGAEVKEDTIDCPKCGINLETGELGKDALKRKRLREMKGYDPADYYKIAWNDSWEFLKNNYMLAARTSLYWLLYSSLALVAMYMFLWCHRTPPKYFWAFITFVMVMVAPGWTWFLHTTVINATVDRLNVLKRINFDFFLNAALGIKFFVWQICVAQLLTGLLGMYFINQGNTLAGGISIAGGVLICLVFAPIAMSHMSMPVTYRGWIAPVLVQIFFKTAAGAMYWTVVWFATMLPTLGFVLALVLVYGDDISQFVDDLQFNNQVALAAETEIPDMVQNEEGQRVQPDDPFAQFRNTEPREIDMGSMTVPAVLWVCACLFFGPAAVFNMRSNGQFLLHYRQGLDLISQAKEVKYQAKADPFEKAPIPYRTLDFSKVLLGTQLALAGHLIFFLPILFVSVAALAPNLLVLALPVILLIPSTMILGLLVGGAGHILCLQVPEETEAKGTVAGTLVADVICLVALIVLFKPELAQLVLPFLAENETLQSVFPYFRFVGAVGFICFIAFMKQIAEAIQRRDLAGLAGATLNTYVLWVVATVVVSFLRVNFADWFSDNPTMANVIAGALLLFVLAVVALYFTLLIKIIGALSGIEEARRKKLEEDDD